MLLAYGAQSVAVEEYRPSGGPEQVGGMQGVACSVSLRPLTQQQGWCPAVPHSSGLIVGV